ncbi:unnamed protein product [Parnassius apollo]|uniref:(apollo) hypothetical protein n=1 Tax=Parnassius apollo TaxID=110799 RepID=A0A8S3XRJ6_PARAO|nr:unnamed protein product [Parnassius apollo]
MMKQSRSIFKGRLKWCQKNESKILLERISNACIDKNFSKFWQHTSKLCKIRVGVPVCVDGVSDKKQIANNFKRNFLLNDGYSSGGPSAIDTFDMPVLSYTHIDESMVYNALKKMHLVEEDKIENENFKFEVNWSHETDTAEKQEHFEIDAFEDRHTALEDDLPLIAFGSKSKADDDDIEQPCIQTNNFSKPYIQKYTPEKNLFRVISVHLEVLERVICKHI